MIAEVHFGKHKRGDVITTGGPVVIVGGQRTHAEMPCIHYGAEIGSEVFPPPSGFGDYVENLCKRAGVTKEWWGKQMAKLKAKPESEGGGCGGCNWRHKALNWVSKKLGKQSRGPQLNSVLQKLLTVTEVRERKLHVCNKHVKCVPAFLPDDELRVIIEKDMGAACCVGCKAYEPRPAASTPTPPLENRGSFFAPRRP